MYQALEFGNYEFENLLMQVDICIEDCKWKDALDTLDYANEFYENHTEFMYRLVGVYFKLNCLDQAWDMFQKAYKIEKSGLLYII